MAERLVGAAERAARVSRPAALLCCMLAFLAGTAAAQGRRMVIDGIAVDVQPVKGSLKRADHQVLGFTVGITLLQEIEASLGPAPVVERKVDEDRVLCYASTDPGDDTIVLFRFGARGGYRQLNSFVIASLGGKPQFRDRCRKTARISRRLGTHSGIARGMTRQELDKLLGRPAAVLKNDVFHVFSGKRRMTRTEMKEARQFVRDVDKNPDVDVFSGAHAVFVRSRLDSITVFLSESY